MAYIEGKNRNEIRFKCLEEEISKDNEVRGITGTDLIIFLTKRTQFMLKC